MINVAHTTACASRLVRLLSGIEPDVEVRQAHFAERFGDLIDFSGSLTLARAHEKLTATALEPTQMSAADIKDAFLQGRLTLVRLIAQSFVLSAEPSTSHRLRLPTAEKLHALYEQAGVYRAARPWPPRIYAAAFEPYQGFYLALQKELQMRIKLLRASIRKAICGLGPELAQLAALDAALTSVLATPHQERLALVPRLLGKRFAKLLDPHWKGLSRTPKAETLAAWMAPGGWLYQFCGEMRDLLIAELDFQLGPVLGMVETLAPAGSDKSSVPPKKGSA